jgi:hypothetical protein
LLREWPEVDYPLLASGIPGFALDEHRSRKITERPEIATMIIVKIDVMNSQSARRKQVNHLDSSGHPDAINLSRIETSNAYLNADFTVQKSLKKSFHNGPCVPFVISFTYRHANPSAPPRNQPE